MKRIATIHVLPASHGNIAVPTVPAPLAALRHHVTGAIERGEAEPIIERPVDPDPWRWVRKRS